VAAGPSFNFASGGKITYTEGSTHNYSVKLANSNFRPFDFGLYLGAGGEYLVDLPGFPMMIGAEIGYTFGTADTFSKAEISEKSNSLNTPRYHIDGKRKNSNLIISLNVSIPLSNLFGSKGRSSASTEPVTSSSQIDYTVPAEKNVDIQQKKCCSLEEMYELILAGKDISTMKVCAFSDIRFDFDRSTIRPESEVYLDMFVTLLHKFPKMRISIIGHTDNVGAAEYNLKLSKERAESVAAYFKKKGIDSSRLHCEGYGDRKPLINENTDAARAMNRRVEFDITAF
jgi:OOP family OmpA-OmpF porin